MSPSRPCGQDLTLEFVVWNYSLETIQDNVKQFEAANPGIKVKVTDYTWPDYQDSIVLRFRGNTTDRRDLWWSGLVAGLGCRRIHRTAGFGGACRRASTALKNDIAGFALTDVTYKDKVYGLPYYADTISFIYNKKILADAGIAVPATWDEVTAAAEKLKAGGMEHPIVYEYNQELPNFYDAFVAQAYGRGAEFFDKDLNPLFADPNNEAFKQLQWLADAYSKGLVQSETHESKIIPAMNTGAHAFTIVYTYVLAALNNAADQPRAGEFALAPMPGATHATLGFAKSYVVTAQAAADPARAEAAWKFVELHGRQALHRRQALGGREGPGLRPAAAVPGQGRHRRLGQMGRRQGAGRPGGDRQGRHLHRIQLGLVGLFPAAAGQGDGRRGQRRADHEGRRRSLEPAQGTVRQPLSSGPGGRRSAPPAGSNPDLRLTNLPHVDHQSLPGILAAAGAAAGGADDDLSDRHMRCGPACIR